jgi:hypothetical protein
LRAARRARSRAAERERRLFAWHIAAIAESRAAALATDFAAGVRDYCHQMLARGIGQAAAAPGAPAAGV